MYRKLVLACGSLALLTLLLMLTPAELAPVSATDGTPGTPVMGATGVKKTNEELMREDAQATPLLTPMEAPYPGMKPPPREQNPGSPPVSSWPPPDVYRMQQLFVVVGVAVILTLSVLALLRAQGSG